MNTELFKSSLWYCNAFRTIQIILMQFSCLFACKEEWKHGGDFEFPIALQFITRTCLFKCIHSYLFGYFNYVAEHSSNLLYYCWILLLNLSINGHCGSIVMLSKQYQSNWCLRFLCDLCGKKDQKETFLGKFLLVTYRVISNSLLLHILLVKPLCPHAYSYSFQYFSYVAEH